MSRTVAKWIFWGGTLVSLAIFAVLTIETHRQFAALTHADKLDETVVAGKRVFENRNCNDCHTILGFGGYYAPDLTRAFTRLGEDSIRRRLENPEIAFADSWRHMPQQHLAPEEVANITAFLRWVSEIDNHDWPPQHSETRWKRSTERLLASATLSPAAALVRQENCLDCHALGAGGGQRGPRLEWIAVSRSSDWIARYLEEPDKFAPGSDMPPYANLSPGQRAMIGEFIVGLAARDEETRP